MLADYLPAFTTASHRSPKTLYLDLFAGDQYNLSRRTGEPISGSPRVALDTAPRFSKVVLFELPAQARRLEAELQTDYPNRDFRVVAGDCNETLGPVLHDLRLDGWDWAPTFALVDQYAAEVRWTALEQLSRFKNPKANLVFATDHDAGERIMNHIYRKAAEAQPAMVAEAAARRQHDRKAKAGVPGLFPPPVRSGVYVPQYRHEPPWPPYELPADDELPDHQ